MVRGLKSLLCLAMALTAFGALGASGVQAAEFHCSVESCRLTLKPDGTGKTAHQVFTVAPSGENVAFTCGSITGEATMATKTAKELTFVNVEYQDCTTIGTNVSIKMNGCDYLINNLTQMWIKCPAGKKIEWLVLGCTATVGEQGPLSGGKFHDAGTSKSELTIEMPVKGISGTIDGSEGCLLKAGAFTGGIETGNAILTGETDNAEAKMANVWWE